MGILQSIMEKGIVGEFPNCEECNIAYAGQVEEQGAKPFLMLIQGKMVCGHCAVKMTMPKNCMVCNHTNPSQAKYCLSCGEKFGTNSNGIKNS